MKNPRLVEETRTELRGRVAADRFVSIVREVENVGPNVAEVARRLGIPAESVRYVLKTLLKKGFAIQRLPDLASLGFKQCFIVAEVAPEYRDLGEEIFLGMSDYWFLRYGHRTTPDERFLLQFLVPRDSVGQFPSFVRKLKKTGFVSRVVSTAVYDWTRWTKMKVELFDFKKGKWNFDWSQLPEPVEPAPMPKHEARELDLVDIGILVALETDATQSLKDIAKQLKVSYKTVLRHFGHVESQGLFACYKVIYTKTQLNPETGNLGRTSHRYLGYEVRVNDVTRHELVELSSSLNRLPYLWGEEGGTNYSAEMVVPLEMVNETLDFVRKVLRPYPGRSATYVIDPRCSLVFAVPVLFDDKKKKWKFGMEDQIDSLRGVLEKVKSDRKASS